jgi:hypothetical protein
MDPEIISDKCIDLVGIDLEQIRLAFYRFVEQEGWEICGSGAGLNEDGGKSVDVSFYLNGRHYWVDIRLARGQALNG